MQPHGFINSHWDEDVLYVEVIGSFNKEGVLLAINKYRNAIISTKKSAFSIIEIWNPLALTSLDGFDEVSKFWHELSSFGCNALAIVTPSALQHSIAEKYLPKNGRVFEELKEAKLWVESMDASN